jgi:uncharacterized membrane protein (DUF106 family)
MFDLSSLLSYPLVTVFIMPIEAIASFIANFVILKKTDVNQMRIATRDYNAFMKEYRQAMRERDQAKVDKLKKKMKSVQDPYTKAQKERLRVSFSYLLPLTGIYYVLGYLIGFTKIIAVSPYNFNLLLITAVQPFHSGFGLTLFSWYFLTYTVFNLVVSRIMGTSITIQ